MSDLAEKVNAVITGGRCMGLSMLSASLQVSDREIIAALPEGMGRVFPGSAFQAVWQLLCGMGELTFFLEKGGNIFEIKTAVGPGKESFGYFNLMQKGTLNGHLQPQSIHEIAFLKIPFMQMESRQIAFLDQEGRVLYSFYLGRENKVLRPGPLADFERFFADGPAACADAAGQGEAV